MRGASKQSVLIVFHALLAGHFNAAADSTSRGPGLPPRAAAAGSTHEVDAVSTGTTHPDEDTPELVSNETVDEEVGSRVEGEKSVGNGGDAVANDVSIQLDGRHQLVESDSDA